MDELAVLLPKTIENLQLPTPELVTFYKDIEKRCFWIEEEISGLTLEVARLIIQWNREDEGKPVEERVPIKFFFFSPGGDLDVNYSIIDMIKMSQTPVWGINVGRCCSAAAYIYLSCHKRFVLPHAHFLFHQGSGVLSGTFAEIAAQMEDYQKQVEELADFMLSTTKYSEDEIADNIISEWYIRAEEAIEKGVSDEIITDISKIL